jgi:hypothetical protein
MLPGRSLLEVRGRDRGGNEEKYPDDTQVFCSSCTASLGRLGLHVRSSLAAAGGFAIRVRLGSWHAGAPRSHPSSRGGLDGPGYKMGFGSGSDDRLLLLLHCPRKHLQAQDIDFHLISTQVASSSHSCSQYFLPTTQKRYIYSCGCYVQSVGIAEADARSLCPPVYDAS